MNSKQLFEIALGDIHPWQIQNIELKQLDEKVRELHIQLDFPAGSQFHDSYGVPCKAYDTEQHTWRHLNFFEHRCYLHARVPRITDSKGEVRKIQVPWARRNTGFTLMFEAYIMTLLELEMSPSCVADLVKVYPQRIWDVFNHYVGQAKCQSDDSGIEAVGIDETSKRKGHDYITVGVDLAGSRVFKVTQGKDAAAVQALAEHLEEQGSPPEQVKQVCIDMSPAFISGVATAFVHAQVTFDRFHVMKEINKALDELRKAEQRECKELKGHKYTLLRNPETLTDKKQAELAELLQLYPKIGEGYRLKTLFREFWEFDHPGKAERFLKDWCKQAVKSGIFPFQRAVNTIKAHWSGIINFIKSQITNGILEGINSKIQLAKKRARGYRNVNNFINMIYFLCGKLNFSYPQVFI
jgi:transposase